MKVLVAGGAGYIGSHTSVSLLEAGHDVVIVDSLVNSDVSSIDGIQQITGKKVDFVKADIRDFNELDAVFAKHNIEAVINFAGHKAVGESVSQPLEYYDNNLNCAIVLAKVMSARGVRNLIFSSSATVYSESNTLPLKESATVDPKNPYGRTKLYIERMLQDVFESDSAWKISILRYFNPVGAHPTGLIGESPRGVPNNLMPYVSQVASGQREKLSIFGCDYDTPDGTGVRDYIHVMDLAEGHVCALRKIEESEQGCFSTFNLGTGRGYSVLEIVKTFEDVTGQSVPFEFVERREGDVDTCFADASLARQELSWEARLGVYDMCQDAWNFQKAFKISQHG
ncbi:MAG: UDP-glucose 4-epimerase GalE [Halieaceae bacterium]|jgi:UDP-glucose 4-epimerase|nr:UDP-glucose 4-epimerase GalE [Halieaceae bacterium]